MSQPRRKMSRNSTNNPDRFNHYNMGGRIVKAAKREPVISLKAIERHQDWIEANREADGDVLFA